VGDTWHVMRAMIRRRWDTSGYECRDPAASKQWASRYDQENAIRYLELGGLHLARTLNLRNEEFETVLYESCVHRLSRPCDISNDDDEDTLTSLSMSSASAASIRAGSYTRERLRAGGQSDHAGDCEEIVVGLHR